MGAQSKEEAVVANLFAHYRGTISEMLTKEFLDATSAAFGGGKRISELPAAQREAALADMQKRIAALTTSLIAQLDAEISPEFLKRYRAAFVETSVRLGVKKEAAEQNADGLARALRNKPLADRKTYGAALNGLKGQLESEIDRYLRVLYLGDADEKALIGKVQIAVTDAERKFRSLTLRDAEFAKWWGVLDAEKSVGAQSYTFVSVMDDRTTEICRGFNGRTYPIAAALPGVNFPPLHYGCRSGIMYSNRSADAFAEELERLRRDPSYFERVVAQLVLGNYTDEITLGGAIAAILNGLIPLSGQAADIRDIVHDLSEIADKGASGGAIFALSMSAAALIPAAGDAIRAIGKGVKLSIDEAVKEAARVLAKSAGKAADLRPAHLLEELLNSGEKVTKENVLAVMKTADGKLVWLETGKQTIVNGELKGDGLAHILYRHGDEFASKGIAQDDIPGFLKQLVEGGNIVGRIKDGYVYEATIGGKVERFLIAISDNGYIVTARPHSGKF